MNILYVPQLSMYDKQTKKPLPQADGNINMMRNTIKEWKKYRPEDKFFALMPTTVFNPHIDLNIDCSFFTYKESVISARINRFNFPMKEFINIFKNWHIDLIICDVIELATNFKQMFKIEFGYTPKIISNIRHIDEELNYTYIYRVIEGIENSDYVTILSESMKQLIGGHITSLLHETLVEHYIEKIEVFEPSISKEELLQYKSILYKNNEKKIITFPGRMSKGEENRTNWDKFVYALYDLRDIRTDFEIYFTDPNNAIDLVDSNWMKTIDKDRKQFLELLNKTDIVVSLMDIQGFGGISIREALLFNCLPIIPNKHEYKRMAPIGYNGFIDGNITKEKITDKLNWALDNYNLYNFEKYGMQFTVESQMKNVINQLEVIINDK